jgi:hypothetical protein
VKLRIADVTRCFLVGALLVFLTPTKSNGAEKKSEQNENEEKKLKTPSGLEGEALRELENDYVPKLKRLIIPPFYREKSEKYELRLLFPFYFEKVNKGEERKHSFGILPFYWRHRSNNLQTDVVFPFYSRIRGVDNKTDIILQTYSNRSKHGYNFGFAPLLFLGKDGLSRSSYQIVPPLFWRFQKGESSFLLAGIFYNSKKEGDFDLGLPPLFFAGREGYKTYTVVVPPIFFRFTNELHYSTKNIIPPFFFNTREHGWSFGAMPLLYLARDREWDKTFVFPFYYGSRWQLVDKQGEKKGEGRTHIFPLLLSYYRHAPGLTQGGAAIFYQWYWNKGDYLRMYTPMVWHWGNDRIDDNSLLVPPLFYRRTSPVRNDLMLGLIYWNFHNKHKERTFAIAPLFAHNWNLYNKHWRTWIFPTFDFGANPEGGYHFRLHPVFYLGREKEKQHLVIAPIYWQFKDREDDDLVVFPIYWGFKDLIHKDESRIVFPFWWQFDNPRRKNHAKVVFPFFWDVKRGKLESRLTLGVPLYWRYSDTKKATTGVLNFFVNKGNEKGNPFWTFTIFPLLAFGKPPSPEGAYWSFLSGLVGWRRQGSSKQLKLFWIPFNF